MHRFYRLDVQPDLFGQWCLMREWGRIGCSGQARSLPFPSPQEAHAALNKQRRIKERRGYVHNSRFTQSLGLPSFWSIQNLQTGFVNTSRLRRIYLDSVEESVCKFCYRGNVDHHWSSPAEPVTAQLPSVFIAVSGVEVGCRQ